jgi:hypothetical protein
MGDFKSKSGYQNRKVASALLLSDVRDAWQHTRARTSESKRALGRIAQAHAGAQEPFGIDGFAIDTSLIM